MKMKYQVVIKSRLDDSIVKAMEPTTSSRVAFQVQKGASINLNHELYYVQIEEVGEEKMDIVQKAKMVAEKQNWELVDWFRFPHPDDSYMIVTVVKYYEETQKKDMFATHIFNESLGENGSFNLGHYEISTSDKASRDASKRI
jgi:hypothetical protein